MDLARMGSRACSVVHALFWPAGRRTQASFLNPRLRAYSFFLFFMPAGGELFDHIATSEQLSELEARDIFRQVRRINNRDCCSPPPRQPPLSRCSNACWCSFTPTDL